MNILLLTLGAVGCCGAKGELSGNVSYQGKPVVLGSVLLIGVDAKTGNVLWRYGGSVQSSLANIPTAVWHGDLVYSSSGKGGGGAVRSTTRGFRQITAGDPAEPR